MMARNVCVCVGAYNQMPQTMDWNLIQKKPEMFSDNLGMSLLDMLWVHHHADQTFVWKKK